jgi:hypothetical protein
VVMTISGNSRSARGGRRYYAADAGFNRSTGSRS